MHQINALFKSCSQLMRGLTTMETIQQPTKFLCWLVPDKPIGVVQIEQLKTATKFFPKLQISLACAEKPCS
uniref:Uncharacterized protein n=1 Tax=Romanomermis culicivorax TaxID=13658 RepID=A0A915KQ37_ROMCU